MFLSIINEGDENNLKPDLYFILSESDINNENIDDLINQKASFAYSQEKTNIIFNIDNFAEEEFEYYSIITLYNNTDDLGDFCFFIDFFNNNDTSFSKMITKGKGKNSKTVISHNINEECFSKNCTIMVFAKSKQKNISKIYTPKIIDILEKYQSDSTLLKIIFYTFLIIFVLVLFGLMIFFLIKKKKHKKSRDSGVNINLIEQNNLNIDFGQDNRLVNDSSSIDQNEEIDLPNESMVYKKQKTGVDYDAPLPY